MEHGAATTCFAVPGKEQVQHHPNGRKMVEAASKASRNRRCIEGMKRLVGAKVDNRSVVIRTTHLGGAGHLNDGGMTKQASQKL
jgi:hypothetical protein